MPLIDLMITGTLNHRVPDTSPGAPTKLFKVLAKPEREQTGAVRHRAARLVARRTARTQQPPLT